MHICIGAIIHISRYCLCASLDYL